jgi:hypothetical protein
MATAVSAVTMAASTVAAKKNHRHQQKVLSSRLTLGGGAGGCANLRATTTTTTTSSSRARGALMVNAYEEQDNDGPAIKVDLSMADVKKGKKIGGKVSHFSQVILQVRARIDDSQYRPCTASMVHLPNLTPTGSANPSRVHGQKHQLMTAGMVHVTNLTPGSECNPARRGQFRRRVRRVVQGPGGGVERAEDERRGGGVESSLPIA